MTNKANATSNTQAEREPGQSVRASNRRSARFWEYWDLARDGKEEAVADLFREFGFRYGVDEP